MTYEERGNRNYYRIDERGFRAVRRFVDGLWEQALPRFKLVAKNRRRRSRHG